MHLHEGHYLARHFFTKENAYSYGTIVNIATLGQDKRWKKNILSAIPQGGQVLELACGTGILSRTIGRIPGRLIGAVDLSYHYLEIAKRSATLPLVQGNAEILPYRDSVFDTVVSSYLAKYVSLDAVLLECYRVLRPGGVAIFHDFAFPKDYFVIALWKLHFCLLRFLGLFAPHWSAVFNELDSTIVESSWVVDAAQLLRRIGFVDVTSKYMTFGTAAIIAGKKP